MRRCRLRLALGSGLILSAMVIPCSRSAWGQTKPPASTTVTIKKSAPDYSNEAYVFQKMDTSMKYAADGTGVISQSVVVKYQSDSAVHESGVLRFPYAAREQTLTIDYARVRKPDGRVIETPADDIQDLPTEITQQAPLYSDSRVKQVPLKGLSVGDTVEYLFHQKIEHPAAPGEFWQELNFLRNVVALDETIELRVPNDKFVKVVSKDVQPVITEEAGEKIYRWQTSNVEPTPKEDKKKKKKKSADENQPSIELTTFKDWAAVGAWYDALQKDRVEVTPEIKAKAQELTKGLTTDDEKIKAIYTYVSTQFRYIGVDFGVGRYQPHHASEVLDNQYGDCKDKHTLLASLLQAEGFTAWPALIRPDGELRSDVPSPAQFNHVITAVQLKGKTIWLDSTVETSPYELLIAGLRGQKALLIPTDAPAHLVTTPENPPYPMFDHWRAAGTLSEKGVFTGHFDITMRNDSEPIFRIVYRDVPHANWDTATERLFAYEGFGGTVTNANASAPNDLSQPFHLTLDYERKEFGDWDNLRIYPMLPAWRFYFSKDDDKPSDPITVGDFGESIFRSEITLPKGYSAEIRQPTKIQNDFVDYSNTDSLVNGVLITERKFNVKKLKIPPSEWDEYLRWEKAVTDDQDSMLQILRPGEKPSNSANDNPQARIILIQAFEAESKRDYDLAQKELDRVNELNPKQPGLMAAYGYLYLGQHRPGEAAVAFRKEVENDPENTDYNLHMAQALVQQRRYDDAIELARTILKTAPDNEAVMLFLAQVLVLNDRPAEAITVLEKAANSPDAKPALKMELVSAYIKANRKSDAEPILKQLCESSDDTQILNDAAYQLTELGLDSAIAIKAANKSLELQETALSSATLNHVTKDELTAVRRVSFIWDTMGWIYFQAGELEKAEGFVRASWILSPDSTVGVHLGEILEKQGKSKEAADQYRMALAQADGRRDDDTTLAWKRLGETPPGTSSAGQDLKVPLPRPSSLVDLRTVKMPKHDDQSGSAEFYILFSPAGVEDVQFISGKENLRSAADELRKAKFVAPFPVGSKAKLIRRGVLDCSLADGDCEFVLYEPNDARAE